MNSSIFRGGYSIRDQNETYFMTFTVCGWIDLFTRKIYKQILIESLIYAQKNRGLVINAFVIMSNHVHLIASTSGGHRLSDFIRDYKKFTHREMLKIIQSDEESRRLWMLHQFKYYAGRSTRNENFQIWTNGNHPEACFGEDFTYCKLEYIHDNPVKAGIVNRPEHYVYSSASNYVSGDGILSVQLI